MTPHGRVWLFALALASGCAGKGESSATSLLVSAQAHRARGEYGLAIADYDRAIAMRPDVASAYNGRGFTYQLQNDYARAIADYDRALALKPDLPVAIKNRGRAHFYLGHFAESAKDLQEGLRLDSTNAFVAVWLHMVRRRLGQDDSREFPAQVARTDSTQWPAPVAKLYLGQITPEQLAAVAGVGDAKAQLRQRCGAAFYVGEYVLWAGKTADAVTRFKEAQSICPHDASEYQGAVAELGRLEKR
jgi:lipoprotein NlpI